MVTFFGTANASGVANEPIGSALDGTPIFARSLPQGFLVVVEARPGTSGSPVGTLTENWSPTDPSILPDLQILSSRALGDGSAQVCDVVPGDLGGVPAVNPPVFQGVQWVSDAIQDLACRFAARGSSGDACTVDPVSKSSQFVQSNSTTQFCSSPGVGREIAFPSGDTRLTVRILDRDGYPGPTASIIVRIP